MTPVITYTDTEQGCMEAQRTIDALMKVLERWAEQANMAVSPGKCSYCIFDKESSNGSQTPDFKISIGGHTIKRVKEFKLLGVTLDAGLTFDTHIRDVLSHCAAKGAALGRICASPWIDSRLLRACHKLAIEPHLRYGCSSWGSAALRNLELLARLNDVQTRGAKSILGLPQSAGSRLAEWDADLRPAEEILRGELVVAMSWVDGADGNDWILRRSRKSDGYAMAAKHQDTLKVRWPNVTAAPKVPKLLLGKLTAPNVTLNAASQEDVLRDVSARDATYFVDGASKDGNAGAATVCTRGKTTRRALVAAAQA